MHIRKILVSIVSLVLAFGVLGTANAQGTGEGHSPLAPMPCTVLSVPGRPSSPMATGIDPRLRDPRLKEPMCSAGQSIAGYVLTRHAVMRMAERGVTARMVRDTIQRGGRYASIPHGSTVFNRNKINVATKNGAITTVFRGSPGGNMIAIID